MFNVVECAELVKQRLLPRVNQLLRDERLDALPHEGAGRGSDEEVEEQQARPGACTASAEGLEWLPERCGKASHGCGMHSDAFGAVQAMLLPHSSTVQPLTALHTRPHPQAVMPKATNCLERGSEDGSNSATSGGGLHGAAAAVANSDSMRNALSCET